jgi:hypothetical protein
VCVEAQDKALIQVFDNAKVKAKSNILVIAYDFAEVTLSQGARVEKINNTVKVCKL